MKLAYTDPLTKERRFTTPLALGAFARRRDPDAAPADKRPRADKGKGSKGKGKSKRGQDAAKDGRHANTPDGKPICFRYNDKTRACTSKQCRFVHACSLCLGRHPAYACKGPAQGADTQGEGLP